MDSPEPSRGGRFGWCSALLMGEAIAITVTTPSLCTSSTYIEMEVCLYASIWLAQSPGRIAAYAPMKMECLGARETEREQGVRDPQGTDEGITEIRATATVPAEIRATKQSITRRAYVGTCYPTLSAAAKKCCWQGAGFRHGVELIQAHLQLANNGAKVPRCPLSLPRLGHVDSGKLTPEHTLHDIGQGHNRLLAAPQKPTCCAGYCRSHH